MFSAAAKSVVSSEGGHFFASINHIRAAAAKQTTGVPATVHRELYRAWRVTAAPKTDGSGGVISEAQGLKDTRMGLYRVLVAVAATSEVVPRDEPLDVDRMAFWKTWIGTLAHLTFREFVVVREVRVGISEVPAPVKQDLLETTLALRDLATRTAELGPPADSWGVVDAVNSQLAKTALALGLPAPGELSFEQILDLSETGAPLEMASLYALAVYLCGKPVNVETNAVLAVRPKNLQDKFNNKSEWATMTGSLKMTRGAADRIGEAWELDPAFRLGYFRPMVKLPQALGNPVANVVATMVSLLQFGQMTHVRIIFDFLRKFPFVTSMPTLSREMYTLAADVDILMVHPEHERLYAKVLYRDQLKAFDARSLKRLIQLAVDIMQPSEEHLEKYAVHGADAVLVEEFTRAKVRYEKSLTKVKDDDAAAVDKTRAAWDDSKEAAPKPLEDYDADGDEDEENDSQGQDSREPAPGTPEPLD